ncbi:hypothetical protein HID58_053341 [Brassica napus]|uniref:(rape) hypothetical protein n=1 Tax=Brassica napus TaxID=3708 RepID=A0A816ICG7_BRANA|nr:protein tesmin/TSO1-like CXC 4 [Brassica napus]KAH0890912.1 hypothetical protein HID58_053341 [Brassica napus]CAF1703395.1 unnamed protein product [Brassica napus]
MDTPDKNRISAVSFCNFEDSPVFQYINGLSPIEPVKADHAFHSLALASPSSLFSSPQIDCVKRHHSRDLSSPVLSLGREDVLVELKCGGPDEEMANVSETKAFKEQVKLAIEMASSLSTQMGSSDEVVVPMDAENEVMKQSGELCTQLLNELDADSDMVIQTEEMEAENGSGEQEIPNAKDSRICSFTSVPQQFSNHSGNVVQPCSSVHVAAGALDTTLSSSSNVAAFDSTAKAEDDDQEANLQLSSKQRSVRRRCLTFDLGGSYKRVSLRDSTNDFPFDFTSINEAPSPQKCIDSSKQETDEILPVPGTIGLHFNALVNPSRNKFTSKDGCVLSHAEEEFTTPVSTIKDLVSCDNQITEEAPERSMEGEWVEELGSCKRCRCKRSRCLKLYCDCFAAGLYCVEPCSCQNCFNRPIHEDIVIKSRRRVEARNPLAFAPKVVLTSASAAYFGEESNKTPASARHMRGCNCKKSGCSKKYCECYLVGVGCSASCRCIGCKNILCQTNEQFHLPCAVESDAVTINEEAKDHCDYI